MKRYPTMKILHTVESYHPSVGGMQEVVRQLSEQLVGLGHDVTVATSRHERRTESVLNGVKIIEFAISGSAVTGIAGESGQYQDFLVSSRFDVVTSFAAQQWATDLALPLLNRIAGVKIFVPTGFSGLFDERCRDYYSAMPTWLAEYDMNVFLSDHYRDIDFARQHEVEKICIIPNGAAYHEFAPSVSGETRPAHGIPSDHFLVLHVGSHTGVKGHADVIRIFHESKLKKATLLMIGNACDCGCANICAIKARLFNLLPQNVLGGKRLLVKELDRRQTVAAYHDADLFLFPSNIECSPLVLFECMASRTPFLTTDVGNASEIIQWSAAGALLPTTHDRFGYARADIKASVAMFDDLCRDEDRRVNMQQDGFRAWSERFTWERISADYETLYQRLLGETRSRGLPT